LSHFATIVTRNVLNLLGVSMAKKEKVVVNGFLLSFTLPTEDLLNITLNLSNVAKTKYGGLIWELKDLLLSIDKNYAEKEVRGRTLRGRYPRKFRYQRFSPYPSTFSNRLKSIRRDWYVALNRHTVVLTKAVELGAGFKRQRNLYLLPFEKAADLQLVKKELDREIEDVGEEMRKYEKSSDWKLVFDYLSKISGTKVKALPATIHGIKLEMFPLSFDSSVFQSVVEERRKRVFEEIEQRRQTVLTEIDETRRAELEKLEEERKTAEEEILQEMERKRHDIVEKAISDLQGRLAELMKELTLATTKKFTMNRAKSLTKHLETIRTLAESVGLKRFVEGYTDSSLKLIEALTTKNRDAIKEATEIVAKEIGVEVKKNVSETLKECSLKLSTEISPRVKALLRAM